MDELPIEEIRAYMEPRLDSFTQLQKRILCLRFGLQDEKPHSLDDVAQILEIDQKRVRQEEALVLKALRQAK